jgi:hypothetical protein
VDVEQVRGPPTGVVVQGRKPGGGSIQHVAEELACLLR